MIERNYPECTTSVFTALIIFREHHPEYRTADIKWVPWRYPLFQTA